MRTAQRDFRILLKMYHLPCFWMTYSGDGRRKQGTSSGISAVVSWGCNQERCTAPSMSQAQHQCLEGSFSSSPEPKFLTGFAIFSQLPYLLPADLYLVTHGTWSQTFVPIRRCQGQFLAWKCSCRWDSMYLNTHMWIQREMLPGHY